MTDIFEGSVSLIGPASGAATVAPNDAADLPTVTRAINVAGSGDVRVTMADGSNVTVSLAAGVLHPIRARRIWATGTTATGVVGLY